MSRTHSSTAPSGPAHAAELYEELCRSESYPLSSTTDAPVVVHETHVSWVFLAGAFAYKVKKPLTTHFLDYGSLAKREVCCQQECRLNRRYAPDLYLGVVPITGATSETGRILEAHVEGEGTPIEFAVKMRRFPDDALLSQRLEMGKITVEEVRQLAETVAEFHQHAARLSPDQPWGKAKTVLREALDNFIDLRAEFGSRATTELNENLCWLESWTEKTYRENLATLQERPSDGFIRECHGDLHLANVISWHDRWTPFDGIEFSDEFRWIDVLSDAAFLAMDFAARGHLDLARSFISAYLAQTGDYTAAPLMRWYLVYRAMVRAKVAALRSSQPDQSLEAQQVERRESADQVALACRLAKTHSPQLWITHGVSGSGKTSGSEKIVQEHGAIRLRSDVERKRMFHLRPSERANKIMKAKVYSPEATEKTYHQLCRTAEVLLRGGDSVVIDATFLRQRYRNIAYALAERLGTPCGILPFSADKEELERRIMNRIGHHRDASDADLEVLRRQLQIVEPLTTEEVQKVVHVDEST